jgi:hypothetical protein
MGAVGFWGQQSLLLNYISGLCAGFSGIQDVIIAGLKAIYKEYFVPADLQPGPSVACHQDKTSIAANTDPWSFSNLRPLLSEQPLNGVEMEGTFRR